MIPLNAQIASRLDEAAAILEVQGANSFRVDAYRRGASTVRYLREPVSAVFEREGIAGLRALPGVGEHLAAAIRGMILTGRFPLLEHMRGEVDAEKLLASVPGIGRVHAERLHHEFGIDTLEDLEAAAHDGRLATLAGFGTKRVQGVIDSLATRLGRLRRPEQREGAAIPVAELLDVDREYREGAAADRLPKVAPRRFNPSGEAWLPVLHTVRGDRHYTALFSNTARAHQLGRTRDWVTIHEDGAGGELFTAITAQQGPLRGRRIVRGREGECRTLYQRQAVPEGTPVPS